MNDDNYDKFMDEIVFNPPYDFVCYDGGWDANCTRTRYYSLKEAINSVTIDGKNLKEIYNDDEFDLIDVS